MHNNFHLCWQEQVFIKDVHLRASHEQFFFVCVTEWCISCVNIWHVSACSELLLSHITDLSLSFSLSTRLTLQVSSGTAHSKGSTYTHNSNEIHSGMRFTLAKALSQQEDMRWKYPKARRQMSGGPSDHQVLHQGTYKKQYSKAWCIVLSFFKMMYAKDRLLQSGKSSLLTILNVFFIKICKDFTSKNTYTMTSGWTLY